MDRRETIKTLLVGSFGATYVLTGCNLEHTAPEYVGKPEDLGIDPDAPGMGYGRTPEEIERDKELFAQTFFTNHEMATIAVLSDIIIPADEVSGSATDAKVPEFIEFIVKDMPYHQKPMREGLEWIDNESVRRFDKEFIDLSESQQIEIVDDIAFPDEVAAEHEDGARFFSQIRNLVTTGFYTSEMGVKTDLGYAGNQPNAWDGVPADVLEKHGKSYREEYLSLFIKPDERNDIMDWSGYEL